MAIGELSPSKQVESYISTDFEFWKILISLESLLLFFFFIGLLRCGKSCRLRWINYLRPDIKRGNFSNEEEEAIISLHQILGNRYIYVFSLVLSCLLKQDQENFG